MQLESLLVNELALIRHDSIWVQWALLCTWVSLGALTGVRCSSAAEAVLHVDGLLMAALRALPSDQSGPDAGLAGSCDDAWNHNQLAHQVALQVAKHSWMLFTGNLHLELGNTVSTSNLMGTSLVVVVPIYVLNCLLKKRQVLGRLLAELLTQLIVEVLQMVQRDAEHENIFFRVSLQLLSESELSEFRLTCRCRRSVPESAG